MSENVFLARPHLQYKESFIEAMREQEKEGKPPRWSFTALEEHFDEFIETLNHEINIKNLTDTISTKYDRESYDVIITFLTIVFHF